MIDSSTIAGIKQKNGNYLSITPLCRKYFQLPHSMESGGYNDYQLISEYLPSPYYDNDRYAEELMIEDEECFRGKLLFTFDSFCVSGKLTFMLVHKVPYCPKHRVEGVVFHDLILSEVNNTIIRTLLNNPSITVSGHTKKHIDVERLSVVRKYQLTKREMECLCYLTEGYSALEIASTLNISRRTVESYISHLKDKLLVRKTSELVAFALTHDIS